MVRIFASPSRYIQGKDVFPNANIYIQDLGDKPLLLCDSVVWDIIGDKVYNNLKDNDFDVVHVEFGGEASDEEASRVEKIAKENSSNVILGLGGGKTVDDAKKVAYDLGLKVVSMPTTASTDAPCSALSVMYHEDGTFKDYSFYKKNPDLVLIDTAVVANAPVRTLIAGIGDAMATNVEALDVAQGHNQSMVHGQQTLAAMAIAQTCMDNLFAHSKQAISSAKAGVASEPLETIVEANTLLSGLGFESAGLAAAHAIYDAFTVLDGDIEKMMHGEKVAYGTLCELMLDNAPEEKMNKFIDFYQSVGLPTTLEDLHIADVTSEDLLRVGQQATIPSETIHNMPFEVSSQDVADSIRAVNEYVVSYNLNK
ncbi:glycerol dehydrogenase [Companilactobacillus metriopterae]|uniref:glycerol dehydrogenase n=1 Tax=Companilactobacillus metriopterae TaxID=1909267 RepID=UPI00100AE327|nr:glycerol dehydrogenase [Companilactobacillus metriopterae]